MNAPKPGQPGYQPTCPPEAEETSSTLDGKPVTLFIRRTDGACMGYRTGPSTGPA